MPTNMITRRIAREVVFGIVAFLVGIQSSAAQNNISGGNNAWDAPKEAAAPLVTVRPAIAPGVFHVVVNALPDAGTPPTSPFVVAPSDSVPPPVGDDSSGTLTGDPTNISNPLVLKSAVGNTLLMLKSVASDKVSITFTFEHDPKDRFYGNGNETENHAGPLLHTSGKQVVVNGATTVPYIWSPSGYGIFVANDILDVNRHIAWSDSNGTLTWTVPDGFADIYLIAAADSAGVLGDYARLTGSAPIPPRWSFGFMLSRWGYKDAADVQDKWQEFRDRKIPVDAFIYDYDWYVNDWDFNPATFPDPATNLAKMSAMDLHFVGIRKPRVEGAHANYVKGQGWAIPAPFGTDLRFDITPARAWWWNHQLPLLKTWRRRLVERRGRTSLRRIFLHVAAAISGRPRSELEPAVVYQSSFFARLAALWRSGMDWGHQLGLGDVSRAARNASQLDFGRDALRLPGRRWISEYPHAGALHALDRRGGLRPNNACARHSQLSAMALGFWRRRARGDDQSNRSALSAHSLYLHAC